MSKDTTALKGLMVMTTNQSVTVSSGVSVTADSTLSSRYVLLEANSIQNYLKFQEEFGALVKHSRSSRKESKSMEWDLGLGWEGHEKMLSEGWPQGIKNLKLAQANFPNTASFGRVPDTDIAGGSLCVASYCSGAPDHYDVPPEEDSNADTKVVKIVVPIGALQGYDAKKLFNRGAGIVSAINAIERSGKQCEVWAESTSKGYGGGMVGQRVLIKWAGAPLDLNNLAVWIGHPATFRRLFFSGRECLWGFTVDGKSCHEMLGGYGGTCQLPVGAGRLKEGTIYMPLAEHGNYRSPRKTMETLSAIFKSQGFMLNFGNLSQMSDE